MGSDDMDVDLVEDGLFLQTVEGEISFFRSVMRTRPVGIHRHFHVLAIRNSIHRETGCWVSADDIWSKLREYYELDVLENLEIDGYDTPKSKSSSPSQHAVRSPSPSENLSRHPYFREEYSLPSDETIDALISSRRMRSTASLPSSSPAPSPPVVKATRANTAKKAAATPAKVGGGTKGKAGAGNKKSNLAGLVGGDSDSSALTQESGDEGDVGGEGSTRMGSVATGTDAGTEEPEGEEEEEEPAKGRKKGKKGAGGLAGSVRTRRTSVSAKPLPKKRKR